MRTAIMTDTNSGISVREGAELGIHVLPMPVIVDEKEYTEGVDLSHQELYDALEQKKDAHTSQPSPEAVTSMWDEILTDGVEELVYIPMSSELSGACATAQMLAKEYEGRVHVADNHRISITQRSSALDAVTLARQGKRGEEICRTLEKCAYDASIYLSVGTLEYLKRSGRITAAGASLATAMNLHPVLNIRGGKLDAQCVCRGDRHTQKQLIRLMEKDLDKRFKFIPPERMILGAAGTFIDPEEAEDWTRKVQKAFPDFQVAYHELSCSIACHVGSNAVAVALAVKAD